nr:MAG TPA: tail protein [Caudoviricetes sp.]
MILTLYNQAGEAKTIIAASENSTQEREIQGDDVLALSFTLYEHVELEVNDYVDFIGQRYRLVERYSPEQKNTQEWVYNVKLYGPESLIKRFLVLNRTDGDAEPVFTLTAPAVEHLRLIVSCINAGLGMADWKVGTVEGSENIVIDYEGKYCDEALKELAEKAGTEYWTEGTTVNLCRCETGEEITLGYGQGLTGLMRDTADNVKFYTRLFPIGSSRNIDRSKYGHARLMLPGGRKYADLPALVKEYGVIHHYEKDSFAGIYPRRIGTVSAVGHKEVKGEDGKLFTIYYIQDAGLDFDPNDYQLPGEVIRMSFQEGSELAGLGTGDDHYFEVNFDSKTKEFEIITTWPYSDGTQLPGGSLVPKIGDKYVLWNLRMPAAYITLAEEELRQAVDQFNARHGIDIARYKGQTDHVWVEDNHVELAIGQRVRLESKEFFPTTGFRKSRITKIIRRVNLPSLMDVEVSDALSRGQKEKINDSITAVRNYTRSIAGSLSLPDIIRQGDGTQATDNNLFSAARAMKEFLNKNIPDTARELITFLKGIKLGNDYSINELGDAVLNLIKSTKIENAGDIITQNLTVTGLARFFKLVIDHIKSTGGAYISSPADGFEIDKVEAVYKSGNEYIYRLFTTKGKYIPAAGKVLSSKRGSGEVPVRYRLYWRASDGKRTRANMWKVGDQPLSMDFNDAQKGVVMTNVSNHYWWSCVLAVSDAPVKTVIDGREQSCHYIEISNEGSMQDGVYKPDVDTQGWDAFNATKGAPMWTGALKPAVGNSVVMLGHRFTSTADTDRRRQSAVYESSYISLDPDIEAPLKAFYIGIDDFNLSKHRGTFSDAFGSETVGTFKVVSDGETKPLDKYISEKAGVGAVLYQLQLTPGVVKIDKDGKMNATRITPKVVKISGGRVIAEWRVSVVPGAEARVWFKTSRMSSEGWMTGMDFVDVTSDMEYVEFGIADGKDQTKLFDRKTVFFVKDGVDGDSGYTITCMPNVLIFDTNNAGKLPHGLSKTVVVSVRRGNEIIDVTGKVAVVQTGFVNISSAGVNVISGTAGISVRPSYISTDENGIPCTSASFMIEVTLPDTILYYTVPISVNVNRYLSTIESNSNEYKRLFDEFKGNETSMTNFKSEVLQSARTFSVELTEKALGNQNLLVNSEFRNFDNITVNNGNYLSLAKNKGYNGTNAVRINVVGETEGKYVGLFWRGNSLVKIQKAKKYTLSIYAYSPNPSAVEEVYLEAHLRRDQTSETRTYSFPSVRLSNLNGGLSTSYKLFKTTFEIPLNAQGEYMENAIFSWRNGDVYLCRPCLIESEDYVGWSRSKDDKDYIGGNLLDGTKMFNGAKFFTQGTLTANGYGDFTTLQIIGACRYLFGAGEIKANSDYVLSMWIKNTESVDVVFRDRNNAIASCLLTENSDGQFITDSSQTRNGYSQLSAHASFTRIWVHFRTLATVPSQVALLVTGNAEIFGLKLEDGAEMTDWTEEKETLTFSLKDFKSYIKQTAREVEINVTDGANKAGLKLGADGGFIGTYRNLRFQDSNGNTHFALTEDGKLKADMVEAQKVSAWNIAQPFEEYDDKNTFLQGKSLSWVLTQDLRLENSVFMTDERLNGAVINIYNGTGGTVDMGRFPLFLGSAGYGTISIRKLSIPAYTLFRALCVGVRANGPSAPVQVGLYPLIRCTVNSTYVYVKGIYD